jgi:TolA-binding protein
MNGDDRARERFARAWTGAVGRALPPLGVERGAARLVAALQKRRDSRSRSTRWVLVTAAMLAVALGVASWRFIGGKAAPALTVDGKQATTGDPFGDAEPHLVRFSNGSTITLDPQSSLEVSEVNANRVGITMRSGAAHFDVVHGAGSTWEIGAGPFRVRVLGTAFRVEWQPAAQRFSVAVTRGAVRVSGPLLGAERVISAGITCAVDLGAQKAAFGTDADEVTPAETPPEAKNVGGEGSEPDALERSTPNRAEGRTSPLARSSAPHAQPPPQAVVDWRELERQGQFDKATQEALRVGIEPIYDGASAEDLMGLARAARLAGRLDISKGALLSCRRRFAGSRDAAMAAYLLGRNAAAADAARWFSTYLSELPDGPLAREASGRLMEAQFASGQHEAARAQARAYLGRYPSGPHADFAKMVLLQ